MLPMGVYRGEDFHLLFQDLSPPVPLFALEPHAAVACASAYVAAKNGGSGGLVAVMRISKALKLCAAVARSGRVLCTSQYAKLWYGG